MSQVCVISKGVSVVLHTLHDINSMFEVINYNSHTELGSVGQIKKNFVLPCLGTALAHALSNPSIINLIYYSEPYYSHSKKENV